MELADRLTAVAADRRSPDGRLTATVRGPDGGFTLEFADGAYRRYTEPDLAEQLGHLAAAVATRYTSETTRIVNDLLEAPVSQADMAYEFGASHQRFRERLAHLEAEAASTNDSIRVRAHPPNRWEFSIAGGSIRYYDEQDFVVELRSAVSAVLADYRTRVLDLKAELWPVERPMDGDRR